MWRELFSKLEIPTLITLQTSSIPAIQSPLNAALGPDEQNFLISSWQILHLLTDAHKENKQMCVLFEDETIRQGSRLMQVLPEQRQFVLRIASSGAMLPSRVGRRFNLSLPYQHASVVLSSEIREEFLLDDTPCYLVDVPDLVLQTEMRCSVRVRLSQAQGACAIIKLGQSDFLRSPLKDIGEKGFRASINRKQKKVLAEQSGLLEARLLLAEYGAIDVKVRLRTCIETGDSLDLGFEVLDANEHAAHILRRYMMKLTAAHYY
jgi:c-di-GMP-binding flagellar brake protein YcgR